MRSYREEDCLGRCNGRRRQMRGCLEGDMRTDSDLFDRLALDDPDLLVAWELWCERGVVCPGFASEVAELRRIKREWDDEDEPLR